MYEIVFYGKLVSGFSEETTKQHVAQLFKTNIEQVERMFTGKRVVIRNKLDMATAQKYIVAMEKRGAECQIEEMGSPGVAVDPNTVSSVVSEPTPSMEPSTTQNAPQAEMNQQAVPQANIGSAAATSTGSVVESASKSGLNLAGDKVDEILATVHLDIDPVGIRLSDEHEEAAPDLPSLDNLSIAPAGSDLADKKEEVPVSVPDISHLSLE